MAGLLLHRLLFLSWLLLSLAAWTIPSHAAPPCREHRTAHYDLYVEGDLDPVDTGRMLEALHRELTRFFGAAPTRRLRFEIYATHAAFLAALRRHGQPYEGGGGLYGPTFGKVWLAIQPTRAYTRQLVLHEATHQFHFLTTTGNRFPSARWYTEGLAEFMGMANWDGHRLQVGVVPAITVEDYPKRARERFEHLGWDLDGALRDRLDLGQAGSWALVHFLFHRDRERLRALGRRLDRRESPRSATRSVYGAVTPRLAAEFRSWLGRNRQPWEWQWDSWLERGRWLEGRSETLAVSTLKETPRRLDVEVDALAGPTRAGIVFGHRSSGSFYLMSLGEDRTVRVTRWLGDGWRLVDRTRVDRVSGPDVLGAEQTRAGVRLTVNGRSLGLFAAPGRVGLAVSRGRVRFRPRVDAATSGPELARASGPERAQDTMPRTESPS